jgi:hypothetical protein
VITLHASAHRQVGFHVSTEPYPVGWLAILAHLDRMHGESCPSGDPASVVHRAALKGWHTADHEAMAAWAAQGSPTVRPHLHTRGPAYVLHVALYSVAHLGKP